MVAVILDCEDVTLTGMRFMVNTFIATVSFIAALCFLPCRVTGAMTGFYFDPSSSPDQKLEMSAVRAGLAGFAFPHYELA